MTNLRLSIAILFAAFSFSTSVCAQIATGGAYALEQSAIANGGGNSAAGFYAVEGTTGQSNAGTNGAGGAYALRGGFWNPMLGPTAASASVSGRILTANGQGIRNVVVRLEGGRLTSPKITLSSAFGYFSFEDVEVGQTYVISVTSKRYGFATPSQAISVTDSISDLTFTSSWQN